MIWLWPIVAVYAVASLVAMRLIAGHLAWSWRIYSTPETDDWVVAIFIALFVGAVWPLVLLARLIPWRRVWNIIPWRIGAEREHELAERERRVREAERELGL